MKIKLNAIGKTLAEAAKISQPCGGMGKCGKCRVRASGALSEPTSVERELLGDSLGEWRLACQAVCLGECSVESDSDSTLTAEIFDTEKIKIAGNPTISGGITYGEREINAAVDIGTTTLEASLYDASGVKLASVSSLNPQRRFGADVITRIGSAANHANELTLELRDAVAELIGAMSVHSLGRMVVTGNTVMLHFFAGLDTSRMGAYPFTPQSLFGESINSNILRGLEVGEIYLPHCVSAFIGADMICALLKAKPKPDEVCLVVDIGTNGEMALVSNNEFHRDKIICASTAAGPALEGAEISCGMRAESGAIDSVGFCDGKIVYTTINSAPARGICGSGLISAAAALLDAGILVSDGFLAEPFEIGGGVFITQSDIRKLQLAKSAIRSGIDILLGESIPDRFCIAGNFGSHLDLNACRRIGLIPTFGESSDRVRYDILGNASLEGAAMLLQNPSARAECAEFAKSARVLSLEDDEKFSELFVDNMLF